MNILAICKLTNIKFKSKIKPLCSLSQVHSINVFRNQKGFNDAKIEYHIVRRYSEVFDFINLMFMFFSSLRLIKKRQIDVIIAFYHTPYGILANLISSITLIPCITVTMGSDINKVCEKYKFLYHFLSKSNYVITRGTSSKKLMKSRGVPLDKIKIVANSLDPNFYPSKNSKKFFDLIYVGDLKKVKRIDRILYLLKEISLNYPNIKLAIVGSGNLDFFLKNITKKLGIEKNVFFLGQKKNISAILNKSKLLVLSSESEGLPQVIIEALSCGLPVITTPVGDIEDIAKNGYNSIIVSNFSNSKNRDNILELLKNKDKYNNFSSNAILSVKEYYSKYDPIMHWSNILKKVVGAQSD